MAANLGTHLYYCILARFGFDSVVYIPTNIDNGLLILKGKVLVGVYTRQL